MKQILPSYSCNVNNGKEHLGKETEVKPPVSNTGAENTIGEIKALIDWCSFTLPLNGMEGVKLVKEILNIPSQDFVEMPKGANGYRSQVRCGDISIFSDGKPEMGIHVCMTGQGCRQYEARCGNRWKELFKSVFEAGGHFSRLDAALDDYSGRFTVRQIMEKIRRREVRTYFRGKPQIIESHDLNSEPGVNDGESVYFGSSQSDLRIRFYNKAVEQGVNYPWVRSEIQGRNERADIMAKMIMCGGGDDLGKIAAGVLRHYVNFIEPCADTNKARWAVSSWWNEFLGCVERVRLTIQKAVKTIKEKMQWASRQWSKTMALVDVYLDEKGLDAYDWLGELMAEGRDRLKPSDYAVLQVAGVNV